MKIQKGVLICSVLFLILIGVVSAMECSVKKISDCGGASDGWWVAFEMYSESNAHVQYPNTIEDYQYALCCNYAGDNTCEADASNRIIRISSETNTHAEIPDRNPNIYGYNACFYGAGYDLNCGSINSDPTKEKLGCETLGTTYNPILSLSADTNTHVGFSGFYKDAPGAKIICCNVQTTVPSCELDSALWGITQVTEGQDVTLSLISNGACTDSVKFEISLVGGNVVNTIPNIVFNGQEARTIWKTIWTGTGTADIKYKFKASLTNNANMYKDSGELVVKKPDEPHFIPSTCSDINSDNYDNADLSTTCNRFNRGLPQEDTNPDPIIECLVKPVCVWENNECVSQNVYVPPYSAEHENCVGYELPPCSWRDITTESCGGDSGLAYITIKYEIISGTEEECTLSDQTIPCPQIGYLPFFGFYQMIISLIVIMIIHAFLILKKKR